METAAKPQSGVKRSDNGPGRHVSKKRAKASTPFHADLIEVRKLATMATSKLSKVAVKETPSDQEIVAALDTFNALISAATNVAASSLQRAVS